MFKKAIYFLLIVLTVLWQMSFLYEFSFFRNYINIILILLVLITMTINYKSGLWFAVISGILLDIYSPFIFGVLTISLIVPVSLSYFLLRGYFARKSTYSLLLVMAISTLAYHLLQWGLSNVLFLFGASEIKIIITPQFVYTVIGQTIMHSIILLLLYLVFKFLTRKIKSKVILSERV